MIELIKIIIVVGGLLVIGRAIAHGIAVGWEQHQQNKRNKRGGS